MRRARGFVPLAIELPPGLQLEAPPLLAVGGHMKNVFALASGRLIYQSQHLGDLENLTGLEFFRESLHHLMRTFEIEPEFVVHDLHPGYLSTAWAKEWAQKRGTPLLAVQHHHAHIAGCMAEHGLEGEAIGLALDGTGYGSDGRIWGGEVLLCRLDGFERFAHLDYVPMPGGEAAIREPWRMALAHLRAAGLDSTPGLVEATPREARVLARMIERGVNAPLTSSLGRLFDAAAAVVLGRRVVDYEAQAAIELEGLAVDEPDDEPDKLDEAGGSGSDYGYASAYRMELLGGNWALPEPVRISPVPLWRALVGDLQSGVGKAQIAARFHAGVAEGFVQAAAMARAATGLGQVALSGGCMANRRLARLLRRGLEAEGFQVFQHRSVSPGDGGLSYGQAVVAAAILARRAPYGRIGVKSGLNA
jgi:hydrogenase maturation protein HypF